MPTVINSRGTIATVLSTELNSLANNASAVGSAITMTETGYRLCEAELVVTFGNAPAVGSCLLVWLLREVDGTNYEDGSASVTPLRVPDLIFPLRAVTTAQRIVKRCDLPPGNYKGLLLNNATGQSMATNNTLKIRPVTESF